MTDNPPTLDLYAALIAADDALYAATRIRTAAWEAWKDAGYPTTDPIDPVTDVFLRQHVAPVASARPSRPKAGTEQE